MNQLNTDYDNIDELNGEIDCDRFIYLLFNNPPAEKKSITATFISDSNLDIQELFKILMYVFSEGMKILYGDKNGHVNLDNLRAGDFREINKYFQSFSIDCKYEINDLDYVSERKATQENLSDIKIFIKTEKFYYSFWFNYL